MRGIERPGKFQGRATGVVLSAFGGEKRLPNSPVLSVFWNLKKRHGAFQSMGPEEQVRMGRVERTREIARRRTRRAKLTKLRKLFAKATSGGEKQEIIEKARKISPFADFESPAASE